ncbi:MAG: radical SAM protein [Nanoarchaeota archaeon]
MDASVLLRKYRELYTEATEEDILKKWSSVKNEEIHLYIHNPFCERHCAYCVYKGHKVDSGSDDDTKLIREYYKDYLPARISAFGSILKENAIKTIMFGGGTPTLMSAGEMKDIFSMIKPFENEETHKIIEIHPVSTDKEKIDAIADAGFNTAIIGIQSFDKRLLESQQREVHTFEQVKIITKQLKQNNIFVCADILTFLTDDEKSDLEILKADLEKAEELDFDEISIMTLFSKTIGNKETTRHFSNYITDFIERSQKYKWEFDDLTHLEKYKLTHKAIRLIRKDSTRKKLNTEILPHVSRQDPLGSTGCKNILGIGSYRNVSKNTFSVIDGEVEYIEANLTGNPHYFIRYDEKDQATFKELVEKFFRKIEPLGTIPDKLRFEFGTVVETYDIDTLFETKKKRLKTRMNYPEYDERCREFAQKYRTIIPENNGHTDKN